MNVERSNHPLSTRDSCDPWTLGRDVDFPAAALKGKILYAGPNYQKVNCLLIHTGNFKLQVSRPSYSGKHPGCSVLNGFPKKLCGFSNLGAQRIIPKIQDQSAPFRENRIYPCLAKFPRRKRQQTIKVCSGFPKAATHFVLGCKQQTAKTEAASTPWLTHHFP